ncbi:MAG: class I SAM-dependent methyltransferase [Bryobacteraceae bacterium]
MSAKARWDAGPGQLTRALADRGAEVVGIDSSTDMIGQARQNFPETRFVLGNAMDMTFIEEFDGVFSNAALHWTTEAERVVERIAKALKRRAVCGGVRREGEYCSHCAANTA